MFSATEADRKQSRPITKSLRRPPPSNVATNRKRKLDDFEETNHEAKRDSSRKLSQSVSVPDPGKRKTPKREEEKRLRMYRKKAPVSFLEKLRRAQTQR